MIYLIVLVSLYLSYYDIKNRSVPNLITLALFISILANKIVINENLVHAFISGSAAFFTFMFVYIVSKGKMGMGDCKYTAIIAFNFGYYFWLKSILYTSIIAIIISLILLSIKKIDSKTKIPFIPFLVAGWIINYFLPLPI